jgi:hypothetical protein
MSLNLRVKILAGAVALALGGTAMANTTLDSSTTGDVFINVVDTTNNTSFLFDTGVSQASFNASNTQSYSFATDANYTAFIAGKGAADVLDYSILSATRTTATPNVGTVLFTSNSSPSPITGFFVSQAQTNIGGFFTQANLVTSATTNSALLGSATTWGQNSAEVAVASNLGVPYLSPGTGVDALVGTALNFYSETSNALRSASTLATLTTLAGTWNYSSGVATYTAAGQAVPLPTPLVLLLSGLGLMGVVARRGKGTAAATGMVAA